jgi:hypothetical protein
MFRRPWSAGSRWQVGDLARPVSAVVAASMRIHLAPIDLSCAMSVAIWAVFPPSQFSWSMPFPVA